MASNKPASAPVVLVVEDEPLLRLMAVDLVEDAGLVAVSAADADEAMNILEARGDVSVVFSDIQMPGSMDGVSLAMVIRDRWPPVKIILTSGRMMPGLADLPEGGIFLAKPYSPNMLIAELQRLAVTNPDRQS